MANRAVKNYPPESPDCNDGSGRAHPALPYREATSIVFAERGYDGGSARLITQKAKANQAAIDYHFGGKERLYREVLRAALHAFDEFSVVDDDKRPEMDPDEALAFSCASSSCRFSSAISSAATCASSTRRFCSG